MAKIIRTGAASRSKSPSRSAMKHVRPPSFAQALNSGLHWGPVGLLECAPPDVGEVGAAYRPGRASHGAVVGDLVVVRLAMGEGEPWHRQGQQRAVTGPDEPVRLAERCEAGVADRLGQAGRVTRLRQAKRHAHVGAGEETEAGRHTGG